MTANFEQVFNLYNPLVYEVCWIPHSLAGGFPE